MGGCPHPAALVDPQNEDQENGAWRRKLPRPTRMEADHR